MMLMCACPETSLVLFSRDPSLEILPPSLTLRQPGSSILTTVLLSYVPVQETNLSVACGIFSNATATSDTELHGQLCNALTGGECDDVAVATVQCAWDPIQLHDSNM